MYKCIQLNFCNILFMKLKPATEVFVMIKTTCVPSPSAPSAQGAQGEGQGGGATMK